MPKATGKPKAKRAWGDPPQMQGKKEGVWYPELVGVVPAYPVSLESFQRRQASGSRVLAQLRARPEGLHMSRRGIPDGWRGRRKQADEARRIAGEQAERIIQIMIDQGLLDELNSDDAKLAASALRHASEIVLAKDPERPGSYLYTVRERLVAMRTLLEWTKAKPVQKVENTLKGAEDFLLSVLASDKGAANAS